MLNEGLAPATSTSTRTIRQHVFSLLQSCNSIRKLNQIHTQVIVNALSRKNYILAKLLSLYIASGYLQHAEKIFEKIENPSTHVWNQVIRGRGRSEIPLTSIELYNRMVEAQAEPDGFTYSFLLNACARGGLTREGEQLHARVLVKGYCDSVFVETNLINFYTRRVEEGDGGFKQARQVFDEMTQRTIVSWNSILAGYIRHGDFDGARRIFDEMPYRNVVSWTTMIAGCAQNGKSKQALSLFGEMRRAHVEMDDVALVASLSACAELGDLKLGKWIHWYTKERLKPSILLSNALIHMYASCGLLDEAHKVFDKMTQKSTVSWTSMIMAFVKQGRGEEAFNLFEKMLSVGGHGVRPDEITFIGVLCACNYAGFVDEGRRIFASMNRTWGISPRIEHYEIVVDLLSRAGFLEEAHGLVETMPIKPNGAVWGALLGGCRIHKNAELASRVAIKLLSELNIDQTAGHLVLLPNLYDLAIMWQNVTTVGQKMIETGVEEPQGRSWIQINGLNNGFVADDMTHKHSSFIYEMLRMITEQADPEEYEQGVTEVFMDVQG